MRKICLNEDHRHADLLLQRVQIGGHVVLFVAEINDDLRAGGQKGFQIQRRLAAVHLAGRRQIDQTRVEIFVLARGRRCMDGRHVFRRDGRQKHRRDRAARSYARERFGNLDRSAERVCERNSRLRRPCRLPGGAAGQASAQQRQRQQQGENVLVSHGCSPKKIALGKSRRSGLLFSSHYTSRRSRLQWGVS